MLPPLANAVVAWFSSISWLPEPIGFSLGVMVVIGSWLLIAWIAAKLRERKLQNKTPA